MLSNVVMLSNVWQAQQVGASCHGLCAARYALHGGHLGACRSVVCCVARPALPCSVLPLFFALSCRIVSLRKDVSPVVPCSCCCCSCLQHIRSCAVVPNTHQRIHTEHDGVHSTRMHTSRGDMAVEHGANRPRLFAFCVSMVRKWKRGRPERAQRKYSCSRSGPCFLAHHLLCV